MSPFCPLPPSPRIRGSYPGLRAACPLGAWRRRALAALLLASKLGAPTSAWGAVAAAAEALRGSATSGAVEAPASTSKPTPTPRLQAWCVHQLGTACLTFVPAGHGHNSASAWIVQAPSGRYFYKATGLDGVDAAFVRTVANNVRAAELGFGPAVAGVDEDGGGLLLAFVEGELGQASPEAIAAFRRPALAALHQLHAATSTGRDVPDDAAEAHAACRALHRAADATGRAPGWTTLAARLCHGTTVALQRVRRPLGQLHNDPNPRNMVRQGPVVHLLDWDSLGYGDPLQDVALYALEHGLDVSDLPALLEDYQGDTDGLDRLQLYLARLHARRLLTLVVGMPWDVAEAQATHLAHYADLLARDELVLGPLPLAAGASADD